VDVFTHSDAFLRRWEIFPDGKRAKSPVLDEQQLQQLGARILKILMSDIFLPKTLLC
jgi:hypothetical protein